MDFCISTLTTSFPVSLPLHNALVGCRTRRQITRIPSHPPQDTFSSLRLTSGSTTTTSCTSKTAATRSRRFDDQKPLLMQSESFYGDEEEFDGDDDDETASMSSYSTNPSLSSCLESYQQQEEQQPQRRHGVSFHPQLVTAVYTRPTTTPREKYHLHYSEWDYVDFRVDWACGKDRATKRVQFHLDDVTAIHTIPTTATRPDPSSSSLYYSKQELQGFLDDFVQSLYTGMDMDYST